MENWEENVDYVIVSNKPFFVRMAYRLQAYFFAAIDMPETMLFFVMMVVVIGLIACVVGGFGEPIILK